MEQLTETQLPKTPETENKPTNFSRKFNLKFGYQDKETPEVFHREVVISRRPTGADFLKAVEDNPEIVQYRLNLAASAISKFGSLTMPVPATALLSLNEIDRDKLSEEFETFLIQTHTGLESKVLDGNCAQLSFGITREGVKYDVVRFGYLLSGYDEINIRRESESEWHFNVLKMAREVIEIATLDGAKSAPGTLGFAEIKEMEANDLLTMREAESQWLDSFRGE